MVAPPSRRSIVISVAALVCRLVGVLSVSVVVDQGARPFTVVLGLY